MERNNNKYGSVPDTGIGTGQLFSLTANDFL